MLSNTMNLRPPDLDLLIVVPDFLERRTYKKKEEGRPKDGQEPHQRFHTPRAPASTQTATQHPQPKNTSITLPMVQLRVCYKGGGLTISKHLVQKDAQDSPVSYTTRRQC
jgi:hypothetical protein